MRSAARRSSGDLWSAAAIADEPVLRFLGAHWTSLHLLAVGDLAGCIDWAGHDARRPARASQLAVASTAHSAVAGTGAGHGRAVPHGHEALPVALAAHVAPGCAREVAVPGARAIQIAVRLAAEPTIARARADAVRATADALTVLAVVARRRIVIAARGSDPEHAREQQARPDERPSRACLHAHLCTRLFRPLQRLAANASRSRRLASPSSIHHCSRAHRGPVRRAARARLRSDGLARRHCHVQPGCALLTRDRALPRECTPSELDG